MPETSMTPGGTVDQEPAPPDDTAVVREAIRLIRERAAAATNAPWRVGINYGAVVGDPDSRSVRDEYEDKHYGGSLVGESMQRHDIAHVVLWDPDAARLVACLLETALPYTSLTRADQYPMAVHGVALARAIVGKQVSA